MAALLDFSNFTFTAEQIRAVSELVMDDIVSAPEIQSIHTIFPNIVTDKEIGFIGEGGLVGKAGQGCDPTAQDWAIGTRKLTWEPKEWEVLIHNCYSDLKSTAAVYSLRTGVAMKDFTGTDYMNIVVEVLGTAMKKFIIRLAWFNDADADTIANGGNLTNGTDNEYFNLLNGFWKQIETQVTANAAQRVTIAENAGVSYAAQALDPDNVQGYLQDLVFNAPLALRNKSGNVILVTQSVYDAYYKSLTGVNIESMFTNLTDGIRTLTFDGKPVIAQPIWDEIIRAYYDTGAKWYNPHRALFTNKSLLGIGVDDPDSFDMLDIWYDKDSRKVKIEAGGDADAKYLNPSLFQVAY